jgi:hypothetical protein
MSNAILGMHNGLIQWNAECHELNLYSKPGKRALLCGAAPVTGK